MQFTITVPDSIGFTRQGVAFQADVTKLSDSMAANLFAHGLTQKVGDSAAGKADEEARKHMAATFATLVAGEWSTRKVGEKVDPLTRFIRDALRSLLPKPAYASQKAAYKALKEQDGREAFLDDWFARLSEESQAKIKAKAEEAFELERRKAESIAALGDDAEFALQIPAATEAAAAEPAAELIKPDDVATPAAKASRKRK